MPLLLEYDEEVIKEKFQDPTRNDGFAELPLTDTQKNMILYRKYEAVSDKLSDTQHDPAYPWIDGPFTSLPLEVADALVRNPDYDGNILYNKKGIGEDTGIIWEFWGRPAKTLNGVVIPSGYVHADFRAKKILTPQQASEEAGLFGGKVPAKYRMWEFRLHRAIWTDGPQRRARLMETAEQQAAHSQEKMTNSMAAAFDKVLERMASLNTNNGNGQAVGPQGFDELMQMLAMEVKEGRMATEQARASFDFFMDEVEASTKAKKSSKN